MSDFSGYRSRSRHDWPTSLKVLRGSKCLIDGSGIRDIFPDCEEAFEGKPQSRVEQILQEYKQFKAASKLQSNVRAWLTTYEYQSKRKSAIIIQKYWRGFLARRQYFKYVESMLQQKVLQRYDEAAIMIQKTFRGWFTRQYIHNQLQLVRAQLSVAIDLLLCVAQQMHHMLAGNKMPGVYSMRNSDCIAKVEDFLTSLKYRYHNNTVRSERLHHRMNIECSRREFRRSIYSTVVPYFGPNYFGICEAPPDDLFKEYERDAFKIISEYYKSKMDNKLLVKSEKQENELIRAEARKQKLLQKYNFCGDVIKSMQRWQIWDGDGVNISPNVFDNAENVENFFSDVWSILDEHELKCYCTPKVEACCDRMNRENKN